MADTGFSYVCFQGSTGTVTHYNVIVQAILKPLPPYPHFCGLIVMKDLLFFPDIGRMFLQN
jgi:hypothetical protein